MNRIRNAFEKNKNKKAFIAFLTAGDPSADKTVEYILEMEKAGADLIEIGIPFSDPVAEGPVIQDANIRALKNGITVDEIFDVVQKVREKSEIPLVFLTYANPVYHYGYDAFTQKCGQVGVDGIIIPDMPYEEKEEITPFAKKYGVDIISLIAPTSDERIKTIAKDASGFIYIVSSLGVTGMRDNINTDISSIVSTVRSVADVPCAVGFGISSPEQAAEMASASDGAIVGSAIVKIIEKYGDDAAKPLGDYVRAMKNAVSEC